MRLLICCLLFLLDLRTALKHYRAQGRQRQENGMRARLPVDWTTRHRLLVLQPTSAIAVRIAIDQFNVLSLIWHPQAIAVARYRRKVTNKDQRILLFFTATHK